MRVHVFDDSGLMSAAAAEDAASRLRRLIQDQGRARIVAATAASQQTFQSRLIAEPGVDWSHVELFQLDEYIGLPDDHPARFSRTLLNHLIRPAGIQDFHLLDPVVPDQACASMKRLLGDAALDLGFLGIGENGHLAFNDPPADFETPEPYLVVQLDEACRLQQVGEGWFSRLRDVPARAVTMSISQMLRTRELIVVVPDERKATAVRRALEGAVSPLVPASILQTHPSVTIYLDRAAASQLTGNRTA